MTDATPNYPIPRTGIGVDVHAFAPENEPREMRLACLSWPGVQGLAGHSDGDAVAHAIVDAVLGACGLGDIGTNFGTSDPRWEGGAGEDFLKEIARIVHEAGWRIGNVAVQVIGVAPRIGKRRAEAEAALTAALGAPVSLLATTTDGLGFTGRGEGVTAIASALVVPLQ